MTTLLPNDYGESSPLGDSILSADVIEQIATAAQPW
jgi:hypothetical protein